MRCFSYRRLKRAVPFLHPASPLRRAESLQTTLIEVAFWTLAVIALTNLRHLHLWGLPQVEVFVARTTMVSCAMLLGLVGVRCVTDWRKSGSLVPVWRTFGGTPGMLLFGAVASYLAIGASVLGVEAIRESDMAGTLEYQVLHLGVLAATAVGAPVLLGRTGADRLLKGLLVVLIVSCAMVLASPVLHDLGILLPYRLQSRLTGAFVDPNDAGLAACMTMALAAALVTNGGPRTLGWIGLAVGVAASLATMSQASLVVLGALAVVFLLINIRSKLKAIGLALAGAVLIGILGFVVGARFPSVFVEWSTSRGESGYAPGENLFCGHPPIDGPGADCAILLAVKDILAGDVALNWSRTVPVNHWQGVTADGPEGRVTGLDLSGWGLNGRIPSELGSLDRLVSLSLRLNRLTGRIPPELGNLANLRDLNLSFNDLTGAIPPELAQLRNLESLLMRQNRLTGTVPAALEALDLSRLRLGNNEFDSNPPESYSVLDQDWANSQLCMPLSTAYPALFDDCTALLDVKDALAANPDLNWHPEIPIGKWEGVLVDGLPPRVVELSLHNRGLSGRVPPELGRLDGLVILDLANNRLTGPVPPELGQLVGLGTLALDRNALSGAIPLELGRLAWLDGLWLRENRFAGAIPSALLDFPEHDLGSYMLCQPQFIRSLLDDCTMLLEAKDTLAGEAYLNWHPETTIDSWDGVTVGGSPLRVVELDLHNRGLNGRIPPELGRLDGLVSLDLAGNLLTGPVPSALFDVPEHDLGSLVFCRPSQASAAALGDCTVLLEARDMLAGDARLNWSQDIPLGEWQGVTADCREGRLGALVLPRMGLNGRVPASFGNLGCLRTLVLDGNALTGAIPPELARLTDLETLGLAANALTGPVPPELAKLSNLGELWLSDNPLDGPIPPELRPVADRATSCPAASADNIPLRADCALLLSIMGVLAGEARLNWSEYIPIEFWQGVTIGGSLDRVTRLELSGSGLNGRIPPELGRLSQLVSLDLSRNQLVGTVPPELGKLTNLERLALSFNALSGAIPPELGGLEKLTHLFLSGNDLDDPDPPRLVGIVDKDFVLADLRPRRPIGDAGPIGDAETAGVAGRRTNSDRPGGASRAFCRPSSGIASDLQADCTILLAKRDVLAGDARLNWSEDIPIEFWQGIAVGGSPKRVTALNLPDARLSGHLFAELGELDGLVALDLSHNRLAGRVPPELEELNNLSLLRLAGNDLNRPFPRALYEIVDHDLDASVFCRPGEADPGLLADCAILLRARDALAGDAPLNWRVEVPIDDWLGVAMDPSRGRVTALELTQMGLDGRIPAELGQLAGLVSLRLDRNRLFGDIPPELGDLGDLRLLALNDNLLAGSVPPELGRLSTLTDLWLHENRLTGPVPPSVTALAKSVVLRLDNEVAVGELPVQDRRRDRNLLCQPSLATSVRLHGDCATLLDVRDELAGDIELNWSDEIPISYWRGVTVGFPAIAGAAAEELRVTALDLSHAGLNGRIPSELSALNGLAVLRLGHNRLAGSIPPELGALSGLRTMTLENNALTGTVPEQLGPLQGLVSLRLGNNELTGPMQRFVALANLRVLAVENNALTGTISPRIGDLWQLEELRLENNRLYGAIPAEFNNLHHLEVLRLGGNAFSNCMPAAHRAVRHNDLESAGLICEGSPRGTSAMFEDGPRLMKIRDILAGDAALTWSYATPVASWQGVSVDHAGRVWGLDLRNMNLTGRIPPEIGELSRLESLQLSGNRLTGPIPPELAKLTLLNRLWLDGNDLTGPIPPEIANLANLRQLWLADNRLTGPIPHELAGFSGLSLAVAGNDFNDCVPWQLHGLRSHDIDEGLICAFLARGRPLLWRLGFEAAMEAPIFGHGLGALGYLDGTPIGHHQDTLGAHNLYLILLGEAGIVPLLLFVSAIVLLLRAQWRARKSLARDATVTWVIAIALYSMAFHHLLGIGAFMFLAGLSVALAAHIDDDPHVAKA